MATRRSLLMGGLGTVGLFAAAQIAHSQPPPTTTAQSESLEEVIVTGFRQSLKNSTDAKREAVGFVDSIYAEDIGKFPDTNIAESFNRIPGVTITRDITGEGLNVAIRGLNTNFTRVLLNNAPVAIASTGQDNGNVNREVDLDLFPTELFSQLTVAKTPTADMVEGGAAGTVNMRMARPFDNEGQHLTYALQGIDNSNAGSTGTRGSLVASGTWGNFGALAGVAGIRNKVNTTGFETIGWTSMNLTQEQCGFSAAGAPLPCNATGGAGAGPGQFPTATLPTNSSTTAAEIAGATYDQAFLLANNPGRTIQQIDNALIPRLGRSTFNEGEKNRYNGIVSLEYRPSDDLHFFVDSMYGKKENDLDRVAVAWLVRRTSQGGLVVPLNMQVDRENCAAGCVVTSGTFANSHFALEYRHYDEETEFWGTNPGMTWQISDRLSLDVQANFTHSEFRSEVPTVLLITEPTTVTYTNNGGIPNIVADIDLNDPANYKWLVTDRDGNGGSEVGRVDMTAQERETETKGGRFSLTWGDSDLNLKVGGAFDEVSRDLRPLNNSQQWQNATCGGNPDVFVPGPNTQPACRGEDAAQIAPGANGYPTYANYNGSVVPNAAVPNYLRRTSNGFATVDWKSFARDTNYDAILAQAGEGGATPTTASWGTIAEDVTGLFTQVSGAAEIGENRLRYNVGVRWVKTEQSVTSRITRQDPRNVAAGGGLIADGTRFPDEVSLVELEREYENWLPSANLAWNLTDNAVIRAGLSRAMTRANPADMLLGVSIPNADVSQVNLGNPDLEPYLSDNIDFGFEYYTGAEGYFGVAAFRKGLEGFTTRQVTTVLFRDLAQYGLTLESLGAGQQTSVINRGGLDAPVQLNQIVNASGRLRINGLEFNWVQPLDFLLSGMGLDGLGFTANYTIIDQKGEGAAPPIAIGVAGKTYNATAFYENHGVSARLSVTFAEGSQGTGPNSNQQQVTGAELFGDDYTQWDFSSSVDFSGLLGWSDVVPQLTLDVINITEAKRRTNFQFSNALFTEYDSGRTVIVGLRGRF